MKRKKGSIRASQRGNEAKGKDGGVNSNACCPYFANLPSHLTAHILLKLPIKSLLICGCVCKNWKSMISEPHFGKSHFERAPISLMIRSGDGNRVSRTLYLLECEPERFEIESNNHVKLEPIFKFPLRDAKSIREKRDEIENKSKRPLRAVRLALEKNNEKVMGGKERVYIACNPDHDRFEVVNSCNGFLCLSDPSNSIPLVICNPVTGEFIRLPKATTTPVRLNTGRVTMLGCSGFGFQSKTNEYKVIKIWVRHVKRAVHWEFERVILEIHTLGTLSWRNVEVDLQLSISRLECPTCVNDTLHWIIYDLGKRSLLCFSFESERLQSFPSPPHVFENHNHFYDAEHIGMGELKGFLYISDACSFHDVTLWVMNEYGIGESWTKVYSIDTSASPFSNPNSRPYGLCCWPVKHFEEGAAILLYHSRNCFIYYEPEKYVSKVFQIHGTRSEEIEVIPHIPSLISLKDIVKGDNIEVLNIHSR